jgi:hypothetical protein
LQFMFEGGNIGKLLVSTAGSTTEN